jgi:hypothetical protein
MFHSDQGVQYTADLFKKTLSLHGINQSMSRRGNCWDNSVQEPFCRSLKSEYLNRLVSVNHLSVVSAVEHYIRYYNNKRIHSAIGNMTPAKKNKCYPMWLKRPTEILDHYSHNRPYPLANVANHQHHLFIVNNMILAELFEILALSYKLSRYIMNSHKYTPTDRRLD